MTAELLAADLTALPEDDLLALYANGTGLDRDAVLAECRRRDTAEARRRRSRQRWQATAAEWRDGAYAQYLAAEAQCRGYLLSREGGAAGIDPWSLWAGPERWALRMASEELRNFWLDHPRITVSTYAAGAAERKPDETEATEDQDMGIGYRVARTAVRQTAKAYGQSRQPPRAPVAPRPAMRNRPRPAAAVAVPDRQAVTAPSANAPAVRQDKIDGARVLAQVYGYLGHMAVWPNGWAQITAALYAAAAHAKDEDGLPVWQYAPRLFFTSREGGSGKSWLTRQTLALCPGGKSLVEMTKASLIDLIAQHATVAVTELDRFVGTGRRNPWLTGIANAGYEPDHMTSRKHGGKVQEIPLFGPMILDGLDSVIYATGQELTTLMSRCIIVRAERAPDGYRPPRFDREKRAIASALNGRLARWMAQEVADGIADRIPDVPEGLGNRPAALWEPLFAVADAAGGDWPALARGACERIESAAGLPGEDESAADQIDRALTAWGAPTPDEWN